jgi:hypothetical protein
MHRETSFARHRRAVGVAVCVDVLENWTAERRDLIENAAVPGPLVSRSKQVMDTAFEQLVLVAEMRVEGRSSDIGALENLLHCNCVVRLLARQIDECLM